MVKKPILKKHKDDKTPYGIELIMDFHECDLEGIVKKEGYKNIIAKLKSSK